MKLPDIIITVLLKFKVVFLNLVTRYEVDEFELLNVSEALRRHIGRFRVRGTITSLTRLFKMILGFEAYCDNCNKLNEISLPQPVFNIKSEDRKCPNGNCQKRMSNLNYNYCNAVTVELQDLEVFNDLERLSVYLWKNMDSLLFQVYLLLRR